MGGKGSGGRNRLTIEEHLKRGTYRKDRHGPLSARRANYIIGRAAKSAANVQQNID